MFLRVMAQEMWSYNAKGTCIGDKLCKVYITGKQQIYLFYTHSKRRHEGNLSGLAREHTSNGTVGV